MAGDAEVVRGLPRKSFGACPDCGRWGRLDERGRAFRPHRGSRRCLDHRALWNGGVLALAVAKAVDAMAVARVV